MQKTCVILKDNRSEEVIPCCPFCNSGDVIRYGFQKNKIQLGRNTFQDATDVRSLKHDTEARNSGYYKHYGYKLDATIDAELDIPLYYMPMEITADEGKNLVPSQAHLTFLGMQEELRIVDDKYATYSNIASSEINGTSLIYSIADNWVHNKKGDRRRSNGCIRNITTAMILL